VGIAAASTAAVDQLLDQDPPRTRAIAVDLTAGVDQLLEAPSIPPGDHPRRRAGTASSREET